MDTEPKNNILRSWKEIAAYLGYDERTCYRWEQKYGMPVHRAETGASKSHVVAYKGELDSWFKATFTKHGGEVPDKPARRPSSRWLLASLVPVAAVIFLVLRDRTPASGQPADFHIRGSVLVVVDESGKELWRRDTKVEGLLDEDNYRAIFQSVDSSKSLVRLPSLVIRDVDGDGRNEVLFAVQKRDDAYGEGRLYCYDSRGKKRWHFEAGREMRFGGRTFSPDYRIYGFGLHDFNGDGRQEVIVISYHYPQWPCQLAVLDSKGTLIGEFWNSGFLNDLAFPDLDGDGREEMIVAGVNNEYGPCLIVFDPAHVAGCSPQTGEFRSDTLPAGSEKYYVRFPRTDVSLALGDIVEDFRHLGVTGNKRLMAYTSYGLIYELDFGLRCLSVDCGHGYMMKHNELRAAGKIQSSLDDAAYRETYRKDVRYWDGRAWVAEPTPNLKGGYR